MKSFSPPTKACPTRANAAVQCIDQLVKTMVDNRPVTIQMKKWQQAIDRGWNEKTKQLKIESKYTNNFLVKPANIIQRVELKKNGYDGSQPTYWETLTSGHPCYASAMEYIQANYTALENELKKAKNCQRTLSGGEIIKVFPDDLAWNNPDSVEKYMELVGEDDSSKALTSLLAHDIMLGNYQEENWVEETTNKKRKRTKSIRKPKKKGKVDATETGFDTLRVDATKWDYNSQILESTNGELTIRDGVETPLSCINNTICQIEQHDSGVAFHPGSNDKSVKVTGRFKTKTGKQKSINIKTQNLFAPSNVSVGSQSGDLTNLQVGEGIAVFIPGQSTTMHVVPITAKHKATDGFIVGPERNAGETSGESNELQDVKLMNFYPNVGAFISGMAAMSGNDPNDYIAVRLTKETK